MYLLWSKLDKQWYCAPGKGLTLDISNAGNYTKEEAEKINRDIRYAVNNTIANITDDYTFVISLSIEGEK